tara:strand:+ start:327 stop:527 length:201 start_codon:yes stop_codon:yes gene_type:complete
MKTFKVTGKATQCIDCESYIDPKNRMIFESFRKNPDYKKGIDPLGKMMNFYSQCEDCGYNKHNWEF